MEGKGKNFILGDLSHAGARFINGGPQSAAEHRGETLERFPLGKKMQKGDFLGDYASVKTVKFLLILRFIICMFLI